ncbi:hypothetical protein HY485_01660 [Candidatus Woesearchaeota archaeon]|nr:hypothetical protein [Candidatus Woesearchaeota archaeon]
MNKCLTHTRETIGTCMWCGKNLCDKCIAHQDGRKLYCENCYTQLSPIGQQKIPKQTTVQKGEQPWI